MKRYYYYGFKPSEDITISLHTMIDILKSGYIKNDKDEQICLFKKDEKYDYTKDLSNSTRSTNIDNNLVFIIKPTIMASKVAGSVDKWQNDEPISISDVVGIAIPIQTIYSKPLIPTINVYMELIELASDLGLCVLDSEETDFTDFKDEELQNIKK